MKQLAIVIVNYKVPHFVAQCLDSVLQATRNIDAEVWVVDNASGDGSLEILSPQYPSVHFIGNSDNVGFARANNQALRQVDAEYSLLLNPDTLIGESTLEACLRFMQQHPEAGALGVRMMNAQGEFLAESKRGLVTPFVAFCKIAQLGRLFPKSAVFNRYYLGHLSKVEVQEAPILSGAFFFARSEALRKVGYLDERYFMYGEDIDLSYSILQAGYRNYYLPIPMLHYKGESESAAQGEGRYLDAFYGAMELFYDKYHTGQAWLRRLMHGAIRLKKSLDKRSRKKTLPLTNRPIAVDLRQPDALDAIPSGSAVVVDLSLISYDLLLQTMCGAEGRGITFLLHDPKRKVTLGPGGIVPE